MNTAWKWSGTTILVAGLIACLTAGAWAADWTTSGTEDNTPRALLPAPVDSYAAADQQDPAPPAPPEFKPLPAKPEKAPRADGIAATPAAPAAGACENGCDEGCDCRRGTRRRWFDIGDEDCDNCCPSWTVTAGAMYLHRSGARNNVIGNGRLTTGQFDEGWSVGPRFEIARCYECWDLEFVYWGSENWDDAISAQNPLQFASYRSRLYNWEWNLKRKINPVTLVAGMRYMELQEKLYAEEVANGVVNLGQHRAANSLYGFQVGAEAEIAQRERLSLEAFTKFGVFSNHIHESATSMADATHNEFAMVAEVGLDAKMKITKNLTAYAGYEVMWLDGVVLAPDTLGVAALGQTPTNTPFYHGANFGLEFRR